LNGADGAVGNFRLSERFAQPPRLKKAWSKFGSDCPKKGRLYFVRQRTIILLCELFFLFSSSALAQGICSAEILFTNPRSSTGSTDVLNLNLFSAVSKPASCLPAQINLTATFFDADGNFMCSGTIAGIADQMMNAQSTNLEVRPMNFPEFVRLRSPRRPMAKRLFCMNIEGNVEVQPIEVAAAVSLQLRVTILPMNGGVATTESRIKLNLR
jgi:hypothetical protein